jgi:hypothetical protein
MTTFIELPVKVFHGDKPDTVLVNPQHITSIKSAFDGIGCYVTLSADHHVIKLTREEILHLIKQAETAHPYQIK